MSVRRATRTTVAVLGTLLGLAGIEHGLGEMLQGNVAPPGVMILSWPDAPLFAVLGGEPALTVVPNLLVAGVLTILASLLYIAWATVFATRRRSGLALAGWAVLMLLVGGGLFPPVLGLIVAAVATRIHAPPGGRSRLPVGAQRLLAALWPWSLGVHVVGTFMLCPGLGLLNVWWGVDSVPLILAVMAAMLGSFFVSLAAGLARDGVVAQRAWA